MLERPEPRHCFYWNSLTPVFNGVQGDVERKLSQMILDKKFHGEPRATWLVSQRFATVPLRKSLLFSRLSLRRCSCNRRTSHVSPQVFWTKVKECWSSSRSRWWTRRTRRRWRRYRTWAKWLTPCTTKPRSLHKVRANPAADALSHTAVISVPPQFGHRL